MHDLVEALGLAAARRDRRRGRRSGATDSTGVRQPQPVAPRRDQRLDVAVRAAGDRAPLRAVARSRASRGCRRTRPGSAPGRSTSGAGRPTTPRRPAARSAARRTRARSGAPRASGRATGPRRRLASSARASRLKRTKSATMRWNHGVARCARLANSPFGEVLAYSKSPRVVADREAHVRRLAGDAEPVQQPLEVRVVAVVEDDEAGVDPVRLVRRVDAHGVRVAARVGARPRTP